MNLSGKAVRYWMNELKIQPENLLVISDDLNIPFGTLRLRKNGSAGGHNGLTNISELLGTQDYARIRVGIGNEFGRGQQVGYVLGEFNDDERKEIPDICKRVIDGVKAWATVGADRAMNVVNTKPKPKEIEAEKQSN
jgi:PTH1 family peptidyl-tRNA hydrolase